MANQKTDPQDIILVKNIDVDCAESTQDIVRTSRKVRDPETDQITTVYEEQMEEWNHADFFQVKWSGHPHRIRPGETRRMPRYIAEHYAKHLADHMLTKAEVKEQKKGLVQSPTRRPATLGQILLRVEEYFLQDAPLSEGEAGAAEVDKLNPAEESRALNLGVIPPTAVGVLTPEPPSLDDIQKAAGVNLEPEEEIGGVAADPPPPTSPVAQPNGQNIAQPPANATPPAQDEVKTSLFDKDKPLPPREQLQKTAYEMGIPITGKENSATLAAKIRAF